MDPWQLIANTIGWFVLVGLLVIFIVIVSAVVIGVVEYYIKRWRKPKQ